MDIQIKFDNGQMNIHMNAFFPTSQARLKKLLKFVDLDFEHRDEIIQTMQQFFQSRVKELEEKRISSGKKALEYKQRIADTTTIVKDKKKPNGVRLSKEELEHIKDNLKHLKSGYVASMSAFNSAIRQKDQFTKHIEMLQQRK